MTMFLEHQISSKNAFSKRSRDTKDWSNDAERSDLPSQEYISCLIKYIKIDNSYFKWPW